MKKGTLRGTIGDCGNWIKSKEIAGGGERGIRTLGRL